MKRIATIYTDFPEKFGVPRQSGLVEESIGKIIFEKPYRTPDAVRGLEEFSHLWLIWEFSKNKEQTVFAPTVRPPRLGGNKRLGVFATRSPFRPNPIGLSSVKIKEIDLTGKEAPVIIVSGADLVSGTPIFDIKPYIQSDCHPDAVFGFTDKVAFQQLNVVIPSHIAAELGEKTTALEKVLANNPAPAYHHDPDRIYALSFAGKEIKFKIAQNTARVMEMK